MAEPGVAARALRRARQRGASTRVQKALIAAGIVESGLQHKKYSRVGSGDRDSVGFLQQRPSQGWGPAGESVEKDTDDFIKRAMAVNKTFKGSAGQLAQAVQRSAFPGKYDQVAGQAEKIIQQEVGGLARDIVGGRRVTDPGTEATVEPGAPVVDRKAAVMDVLRSGAAGGLPKLGQGSRLKRVQSALASGAYTSRGPVQVTMGRDAQLAPNGSVALQGKAPKPSGGYMGTEGAVKELGSMAKGLTITSRKRDNTNPASGSRSDHDHSNKDAYAHDYSNGTRPTPQMDEFAYRLAHRLGNTSYKKGTPLVMTKVVNGIRHQVLYRTNVGGNHHNHVHHGAKRVGHAGAARRRVARR